MSSERKLLILEAILDALAVPKSDDREAEITASHAASYRWLWEPMGAFPRFLTDPTSRLFWFSGLPGSGKSTLLRYIKNSRQLGAALERWRDAHALDIASFFFWESGLVSQRSFEGALRSILHQLLSARPHLVLSALPNLWAFLQTASTVDRVRRLASWHASELQEAVVALFASIQSEGGRRVLLFLDGIDEFEGDPDDIVRLLQTIAAHDSVKICVSSRPWPVFERAFAAQPHLRLQDATRKDMEAYVAERLADVGSARGEVVRAIVDRAEGVFLWATVAVDEVNRWDVKRRSSHSEVESLPLGPDNLYRHLLVDIASEVDRRSAAEIFRLIIAREDVCAFTRNDDMALLTAWDIVLSLHFGDQDALSVGQIVVDEDRMTQRSRKQIELVKQCSRRLLKFAVDRHAPQDSPVSFYHRTVRTWVRSEASDSLLRWNENDPHATLLRTILLSWKVGTSPKPKRTRNVLGWWSQIMTAFTHARLSPASEQDRVFDLLIELDRTLDSLYLTRRQPFEGCPEKSQDSWARSCFGTLESRGQMPYEDAFLALAIRFGLTDFVQKYLDRGLYEEGEGYPLLTWSTIYLFNRQSSIYPLSDPRIIAALLGFGVDPNRRVRKSANVVTGDSMPKFLPSPWESTLEVCQQAMRRGWVDRSPHDSARWRSVIEEFLRHGADRALTIQATYKDQREPADDILSRVLSSA